MSWTRWILLLQLLVVNLPLVLWQGGTGWGARAARPRRSAAGTGCVVGTGAAGRSVMPSSLCPRCNEAAQQPVLPSPCCRGWRGSGQEVLSRMRWDFSTLGGGRRGSGDGVRQQLGLLAAWSAQGSARALFGDGRSSPRDATC